VRFGSESGGESEMIDVKAISRQEIDAWPLEEAGIPIRLLTAALREKYVRIADLRPLTNEKLLKIRGIGASTLREWRAYLRMAADFERGLLRFSDVREILNFFLEKPEMQVLIQRYGLLQEEDRIERSFLTLQQIGTAAGLTRERVRQMEESGLSHLSSRTAQACLDPVYSLLEALFTRLSHVAEPADFALWRKEAIWGGFSPHCVVQLLNDLRNSPWTRFRGYLSSLSRTQLETIETALVGILRALGRPVNSHQLSEETAEALSRFQPANVHRLIEVILRHCPSVKRNPDGSFEAV